MAKLESRLLGKDELDSWDLFVSKSPQGSIYCNSWWLDAVTNSDYEIFALCDGGGEIVFGMPLPFYKAGNIQKPVLSQTLGVLLHPRNYSLGEYKRITLEKKYINLALEFLEENVDSYRMYFSPNFTNWLPFRWKGYKQTTRYTYKLACALEGDLREGYSSRLRRILKKARNYDMEIIESDDIELFYELNKKTFSRQGMPMPYSPDIVYKLDSCLAGRGQRKILSAIYKGLVVSSSYFVFDGAEAIYLMSGSVEEYRYLQSQALVMDYAIHLFKGRVKLFDFEGSMNERIEEHFRSYGSKQYQYFEIRNDI